MRRSTHLTLPAVLILAFASGARAQAPDSVKPPTIQFGPALQFGFGADQAALPVFQGSTDCGIYDHGSSVIIGGGAVLLLPHSFGENLGLQTTVLALRASSTLSAKPVDPTRINDAGTLVEIDREYRLAATELNVALELAAHYRATDNIALTLGPRVGYHLSTTTEATDNVVGSGEYRFSDGQRQRPLVGASTVERASLAFGGVFGASYEIPIRSMLLVPSVALYADLLSQAKGESWKRVEVAARVALLFDITPSPAPPPPPPDTVKPIEPVVVVARERPRLSASISIVGLDDQNRPLQVSIVRVNDVIVRRYAPLVPAVFFEHDTAALPERYPVLDASATDKFSIDNVAGLGALEVQHRLLDIVGSRLQQQPATKVTLVGSTSRDESGSLARERAATVRSYLENVWGIAPARIQVQDAGGTMARSNEATDDGRAENRRVEIMASDDGVTAPAASEHVERDFNPPLIRMSPGYEAEAGMKRWKLTVTQGGTVVAQYTNRDSGALAAPELTWNLASQVTDTGLAPLVAELEVEDSTGATARARSQVPMVLERKVNVVDGRVVRNGDREQIAFSIVGFDYNSSELTRSHEAVLRDLVGSIRPGAQVTVTGYTDRIGEQQHNVELSAQRADKVAAALRARLQERGVKNVKVTSTGAGIETERFSNDLSEGRVLSRGVSVMIDVAAEPH